MPVGAPSPSVGRAATLEVGKQMSCTSWEAGGKLKEHQQQRERAIENLMHNEERVQDVFERLSNMYSSEQDRADYFLTEA